MELYKSLGGSTYHEWAVALIVWLFAVPSPLPVAPAIEASVSYHIQRVYHVRTQAARIGLDPDFAVRVSLAENWSGHPEAVSPTGCCVGIMQIHSLWLTSGLVDECGYDLIDMETNACMGVRILQGYLTECEGEKRCALHKYVGATSERGKAKVVKYVASVLEET
jgi:hypothetical protein